MSIRLLICISVWGHNCSDVPASHLGSTNAYTPTAPTCLPLTLPTVLTRGDQCYNQSLFFFSSAGENPHLQTEQHEPESSRRNFWASTWAEGLAQVIPGSSALQSRAQGAEAATCPALFGCYQSKEHLEFTNILFLSLKSERKNSISNQNEKSCTTK